MPPRVLSRHTFTEIRTLTSGSSQFLTDRVPFSFRKLDDTIPYTVSEGDTLWSLAGRFYQGLPRPSGLWWAIADFQPSPIFDPTIRLEPGTLLFIPSLRTVQELIFDADRVLEDDT